MRVTLAICMLVLGAACGTTSEAFQRSAFTTIPTPPLGVAGGQSGFTLAGRVLTGEAQPQAEGGAVSTARWQPEVGALISLADDTWATGSFRGANAAIGATPSSVFTPAGTITFDASFGIVRQVRLAPVVSAVFSGEVGATGVNLALNNGFSTENALYLLFSARFAAALAVEPLPSLRLFGGAAASTATWNDATGVITTNCDVFPCQVTDTGVLAPTLVLMLGGGVRWRPVSSFSIGLEVWVPVTRLAVALPAQVALTVTLGTLDAQRAPRPVVRQAPPEPPAPPSSQEPMQL